MGDGLIFETLIKGHSLPEHLDFFAVMARNVLRRTALDRLGTTSSVGSRGRGRRLSGRQRHFDFLASERSISLSC